MTGTEVFIGAVLVAWLASGLAAACLTPRNPAARALLVAGVLLGLSALVDAVTAAARVDGLAFALLRTAGRMAFLGAVAAIVATLTLVPDGVPGARWHSWLTRTLATVAVAAPVLELLGSEALAVDDDPPGRANPLAVPALEPLADIGAALGATEPAWVLLGVAVLVLRWRRGDAEERRELNWALGSVALLASMLLAVVGVEVSGAGAPPEELAVPLFLLALGLFPVAALIGITRRARSLEARLRESRERLVNAEDAARRALERDVHDGVQQQLVAALSLIALAAEQERRRPDAARATVAEVGERLRAAMSELRELVRGIRPPVLQDAGLVPAIESRLAGLPVEVALEADGAARTRWAPAVEAAAYFVVTEAVTNALKHAPGSRVVVRMSAGEGRLLVEVADDGPGTADDAAADGRGLRGLQDRVESLRGRFTVMGRPGEGTVVRAVFPARGDDG